VINFYHTAPQPFYGPFQGSPGWAGARRELLDLWCKGKLTGGRHTDHPAGRHSIRPKQCPPPSSPMFFYRPDALLPPNQQCQSTECKQWLIFSRALIAFSAMSCAKTCHELCKNGWTNRDAVRNAELGGSVEQGTCITWECRCLRGKGHFWVSGRLKTIAKHRILCWVKGQLWRKETGGPVSAICDMFLWSREQWRVDVKFWNAACVCDGENTETEISWLNAEMRCVTRQACKVVMKWVLEYDRRTRGIPQGTWRITFSEDYKAWV